MLQLPPPHLPPPMYLTVESALPIPYLFVFGANQKLILSPCKRRGTQSNPRNRQNPTLLQMKIGVQARLLAEPYTGVGSYTEHLFTKLAQDHPEDEYTLFTYKKVTTTFPKNIKIKVIPEKKWLLLASLKKGYWERFQVPKFFKNFDIIHHTYPNLAPGGIVTIHDVIPWKNKKYRASLRSKTYFHLVKKALKKADKILAVSQTTKKEAVKYLGLSPKKITVTYEAADPEYLRPANKNPIDPPYLLYVGGYDERKNIDYLIEVFSKTKHPNLKLVLAGGKVKNTSLYDSHNLQKSSKNDKINLLKTGFVSIEELNALYRGAQANYCSR